MMMPNDVVEIKMEIDDDDDDQAANDADDDTKSRDNGADNVKCSTIITSYPTATHHPTPEDGDVATAADDLRSMPKLRLNTDLASDPALQPDARDIQKTMADADDENSRAADSNDEAECRSTTSPASPPSHSSNHHASSSVLLSELTRDVPPPLAMVTVDGPAAPPPQQHIGPIMFVCDPCGIKFSSRSTLEAHQTHYCSYARKKTPAVGGSADDAGHQSHGTAKKSAGSNAADATSAGAGDASRAPIGRLTKLYACSQCNYSADKKVSLNRHMRSMHHSSPGATPTPGQTAACAPSTSHPLNGDGAQQQVVVGHATVEALLAAAAVGQPQLQQQQQQILQQQQQQQLQVLHQADRYCSDCDIPFSSTKTFRAHKQHYCSGRQRDGVLAGGATTVASAVAPAKTMPVAAKSRSQSPQESSKSPAAIAAAPQPYLALPTNPIIIIPYSMIRGASILPGPL